MHELIVFPLLFPFFELNRIYFLLTILRKLREDKISTYQRDKYNCSHSCTVNSVYSFLLKFLYISYVQLFSRRRNSFWIWEKNLFIDCQRCLIKSCQDIDCNNKISDIVCRNVSLFSRFKIFYSSRSRFRMHKIIF